MAPAWVVAPAGSPPWVGELPLKLDPTTGGGNVFWETDSGCQCTRRGRAAKSRPSGGIFFWPVGWPGTRGGPPRGLNGAPESVRKRAGPHTSSPAVAGRSTAGSPNAQNPTRHRRPGRPRLLKRRGTNGFHLPKGGSWWASAALLSSEWPKNISRFGPSPSARAPSKMALLPAVRVNEPSHPPLKKGIIKTNFHENGIVKKAIFNFWFLEEGAVKTAILRARMEEGGGEMALIHI